MIQWSATDDRVDPAWQAIDLIEIAAQPLHAGRLRLHGARDRNHAPPGIVQASQQRRTDLAAATEYQCIAHHSCTCLRAGSTARSHR